MKKILAFTLAETLIVMGIIGIVSALTLPNLNSSTGEKEKVAKVKKIYQNINDAIGRAIAVYGPVNEWYINDGTDYDAMRTRFAERLLDFMKATKVCGLGYNSACFSLPPCNSSFSCMLEDYYYKFQIADGSSLGVRGEGSDSVSFIIDVDGPNKGKSELCSDIFIFSFDSVTGQGRAYTGDFNKSDYYPCGAWVLRNENLDYLKTTDGKTCSNGKVLNWDNQTTCK